MAWNTVQLDQLDPKIVSTIRDIFATIIEESNSELDVRRGVFRGQVLEPAAILAATQHIIAQRILDSASLLRMAANPDGVDDELLNDFLHNYGITRIPATNAAGDILLVFQTNAKLSIPAGTIFTAPNGRKFVTTLTVRARDSENDIIVDADRLLMRRPDGTYSLTAPATAVTAGIGGNIKADTVLTATDMPATFIEAYAYATFSGGQEATTIQTLLAMLAAGNVIHTFHNRATILGMLRNSGVVELANTKAVSVVGMGDSVMLRDNRGILPIAQGGKCDIYVRTQDTPARIVHTVEATLQARIDNGVDGGLWYFSLDRDTLPGLYDLHDIRPENASPDSLNFDIILMNRNYDDTGTGYVPDIVMQKEAIYSRYQTLSVWFHDRDTLVDDINKYPIPGTTAKYDIAVTLMPHIDKVQDYLGRRDVRPPAIDLLVKAAIPCIIGVDLEIMKPDDGSEIDSLELADALAVAVNNKGFGESLQSSFVHAVVGPLLPHGAYISDIDMSMYVRPPDASPVYQNNSTVLVPPIDPAEYLSTRTQFLSLDAADVHINIIEFEVEE